MYKEVALWPVVVASPADVKLERDSLAGILDEVNRDTAHPMRVHLDLHCWETDAYPGFHIAGPQGLIDPVLDIQNCAILIGIFWRRFGTPTRDGQTGTAHELKTAVQAWQRTGKPHVMVYFKEKGHTEKSTEEAEQWKQVLDFKCNFPSPGLWWPYKTAREFEKLVPAHLRNYLRQSPQYRAGTFRDFKDQQDAVGANVKGVKFRLYKRAVDTLLDAVEFYEIRTALGEHLTRQLIEYLMEGKSKEMDQLLAGCAFKSEKREHLSRVAKEAFQYLDALSPTR